MERAVYITENCLVALMLSCLETPHKEVGGFLIGREDKRFIGGERVPCLTLDVAYQIRTCKSGNAFWQPGNVRAYKRIVGTISSMNFNIVGEYHSHIHNVAEISDNDVTYIKQEVEDFKKSGIIIRNWIEMVLNVEAKTYARKPAKSFDCSHFSKKLRCTVRGVRNPLAGYSVTIGTYWFDPSTFVHSEAGVHIP
jgi:hypothetical protein